MKVLYFVKICGSISDYEISKFMREIKGIINAYPNLNCRLWYADHECYGPYNIDSMENVPKPKEEEEQILNHSLRTSQKRI